MYGCGRNPMPKSLKFILSKSKSVCLLAQIPGLRSTVILYLSIFTNVPVASVAGSSLITRIPCKFTMGHDRLCFM